MKAFIFIFILALPQLGFSLDLQIGQYVEFQTTRHDGSVLFGRKMIIDKAIRHHGFLNYLVEWKYNHFKSLDEKIWIFPGYRDLAEIDNTRAFCQDLRANNKDVSASIELISVPAGKFETCKTVLHWNNKTIWWSQEVPFGKVKEVSNKASAIILGYGVFNPYQAN